MSANHSTITARSACLKLFRVTNAVVCRTCLLLLIAACAMLGGAESASAEMINRLIDFSYVRDPGPVDFSLQGDTGGNISLFFEIEGSLGNGREDARFAGLINANFEPHLDAPGTTNVFLGSAPGRYSYRYYAGMSLEAGLRTPVASASEGSGFEIQFAIDGGGSLPALAPASDKDTIGLPVGIPFIASAEFGLTHDSTLDFRLNRIKANVLARHRETGQTRTIFGDLGSPFAMDLDLPGTWDISLTDLSLRATIDQTIRLGLGVGLEVFGQGVDDIVLIPTGNHPSSRTFNLIPDASLAAGFQDWFQIDVAPVPGDGDYSGAIGMEDFTIWADHFGMINPTFRDGDYSGDGQVDIGDFTIWADAYTPMIPTSTPMTHTSTLTAVPEPGTYGMLFVGGLLVAGTRMLRRKRTSAKA